MATFYYALARRVELTLGSVLYTQALWFVVSLSEISTKMDRPIQQMELPRALLHHD